MYRTQRTTEIKPKNYNHQKNQATPSMYAHKSMKNIEYSGYKQTYFISVEAGITADFEQANHGHSVTCTVLRAYYHCPVRCLFLVSR